MMFGLLKWMYGPDDQANDPFRVESPLVIAYPILILIALVYAVYRFRRALQRRRERFGQTPRPQLQTPRLSLPLAVERIYRRGLFEMFLLYRTELRPRLLRRKVSP